MTKIHLSIIDKNMEFLNLFKKYIRDSEYRDQIIIYTFTNISHAIDYFNSKERVDILLVNEEEFIKGLQENCCETIIYLSDHELEGNKEGIPIVNKYQPLNQLVSKIISIFYDENSYIKTIDHMVEVISIYSTTGFIGKTTMALNLAKELALRGDKVFYLDLQFLNTTEIFFKDYLPHDLSKVFYYLKANPMQLNSKIDRLKKFDPFLKVDYLGPVDHYQEMQEISMKEIELLIDQLKTNGTYRYIIIDLNSSSDDVIIGALLKSDYIFWLLTDDNQYLYKTNQLLNQYKAVLQDQYHSLYKKIRFIVNRFLGNEFENNFPKYNLFIDGYLPYIPKWKVISEKNQLFNVQEYDEAILKLVNTLL